MRICSFGEVNASIRAHYAIAAWRPALEAGLEIDADSEFPLVRALREDSKRETLHMRLPQISADGDGPVRPAAHSVPYLVVS